MKAEPLKGRLKCYICDNLIKDCDCTDSEGDKYEKDLQRDGFVGSDVKSAVEWLKKEVYNMKVLGIIDRKVEIDFRTIINEAFEDVIEK